jgi:hypothetical protein
MPLTTSITTPDGALHAQAHAIVFPLLIQTLPGQTLIEIGLHCWHDEAAMAAGMSELSGYPETIELLGSDAELALGAAMGALAQLAWSGNPETDTPLAIGAIVTHIEDVVIAHRPQFSRIAQ